MDFHQVEKYAHGWSPALACKQYPPFRFGGSVTFPPLHVTATSLIRKVLVEAKLPQFRPLMFAKVWWHVAPVPKLPD